VLFAVVAALAAGIAALPPLWAVLPLLVLTMATLGVGNGAVFQVIPQLFRAEIGVVTGLVGAAGGIGGFYLPTVLGALKGSTGSFGPGFAAFAVAAILATVLLALAQGRLHRAVATSRAAMAEPAS
jgi:NNP family nitrate/nitrite transporter-like MFS transporter